jgi:hypothetical protein
MKNIYSSLNRSIVVYPFKMYLLRKDILWKAYQVKREFLRGRGE